MGWVRPNRDQVMMPQKEGLVCGEKLRREEDGMVLHGMRKDKYYPFFLTNNQELVVRTSSSPSFVHI